MNRKQWKKEGRKSLKSHYWIFVTVCLFAALIGTEYVGSLDFLTADKGETRVQRNVAKGKKVLDTIKEEDSATLPSTLTDNFSDSLIYDLLNRNHSKAEQKANANEKKEQQKTGDIGGIIAVNHQKGVLATVVNKISSGTLVVTVYSAILSLVGKDNSIASFIFVFIALFVMIALWVFFVNVYKVTMKRIFMEGTTYEIVRKNRFLFLAKVGRHAKASKAALKWTVYETLWSLTIVGYFIKHYSYFMTPYILAENPDLTGREAITLSRKIMYGHKWEAFKLEFSFILWDILGVATFGLTSMFYVAPYKEATYSHYYKFIRQTAFDNEIDGCSVMNDKWLFEKPERKDIKPYYLDFKDIRSEGINLPKEKGLKGFLAKWFGLVPFMNEYEWDYRRIQTNQAKVKHLGDDIDGLTYPRRMFSLPEKEKSNRESTLLYTRRFSFTSAIMIFFVFCFIGWGWEVCLHLLEKGEFVNRGVNYGPWLPIYGSGGIGALLLFTRIKKYPLATFFASVVFCGAIEYITGASLLAKHGARFWNYSGYFLNINGHICAEGLLVFGVACMACIYIVAPVLDDIFSKLSLKLAVTICVILITFFVADTIYSRKYPNLDGMSTKSRNEYIKENPDAYKHQLWYVLGINYKNYNDKK